MRPQHNIDGDENVTASEASDAGKSEVGDRDAGYYKNDSEVAPLSRLVDLI